MQSFLTLAVAAHLPLVAVRTDDTPNFGVSFKSLTGRDIKPIKATDSVATIVQSLNRCSWVLGDYPITDLVYRSLVEREMTLVIVNYEGNNPLVFDAGDMPTPVNLLVKELKDRVEDYQVDAIARVLHGLSLRAAMDILALTQAKYPKTTPKHVRDMRLAVSPPIPGLQLLESDIEGGMYKTDPDLSGWVQRNRHFWSEETPVELRPRGLMLHGMPGVGKTSAARYIAREFQAPLFRLDLAAMLTKYVGDSEARLGRILHQIESEAPCVLLIDEVEKLFNGQDDSGVVERLLSQLLWWLQSHRSLVITIMTSNDLRRLPPELYRPGRIDQKLELRGLTPDEIGPFALAKAKYLGIKGFSLSMSKIVSTVHQGESELAHATVCQRLYDMIKAELTNKMLADE